MLNVKKNRTVCMCYLVLHSVHAQQNDSFSLFVPAIKKAGVKSITEPCQVFWRVLRPKRDPSFTALLTWFLTREFWCGFVCLFVFLFVCLFVCLFA